MNNHYLSGIHYQKKVQNSEIGELLREKEYFINATGSPFYLSPNIPPLMPQAVNNNIITNYHPRLARRNIEFSKFYSQESCRIIENIIDNNDNLMSNSIFIIDNDSVDKCISYKFDMKLPLPNENKSIYSITEQ